MDGILCTILSGDTDALLVGIACETTRVSQQCGKVFISTHLVEHRTLHLTTHFHQFVVGTHHHDVVVIQSHIASGIPIEDIVIYVNRSNGTPLTEHLNITQRTNVIDTTCCIKGIEC